MPLFLCVHRKQIENKRLWRTKTKNKKLPSLEGLFWIGTLKSQKHTKNDCYHITVILYENQLKTHLIFNLKLWRNFEKWQKWLTYDKMIKNGWVWGWPLRCKKRLYNHVTVILHKISPYSLVCVWVQLQNLTLRLCNSIGLTCLTFHQHIKCFSRPRWHQ